MNYKVLKKKSLHVPCIWYGYGCLYHVHLKINLN